MIEIGLVGVPNSGKSTFFKALSLKDVKIANYPFTTLEPNEGLGHVTARCPCKELGLECKKCYNGIRFVPVKIWDVAGLVPDAHLGRGRGNAFLDDLMQASAFIHVLDISGRTNNEGNITENNNPEETAKMLEREIDHWLLGLIKKDWKHVQEGAKEFIPTFENRFSGLQIMEEHIDQALNNIDLNPAKCASWSDSDLLNFVTELRRIAKPTIIAANKMDVVGAKDNLEKLNKYNVIPCSAEVELALREANRDGLVEYMPGSSTFKIIDIKKINEKQKKALDFIKKFLDNHKTTGVQNILNELVFNILNMIVVYPVENEHKFSDKKGNVLPDAYLLPKGSTAQDLAYKVHKDIGKSFITAIDARTRKNIAADYKLKNSDIISIKAGR